NHLRLQSVAKHQARVTWISAADHGERRRSAALDHARVETRHFGRAAHIEVEPSAPKLLDALDGLAGFELGLDDVQIVLVVSAGLLGDGMNDGGEIGMQYTEAHGIPGSGHVRRRDESRS